MTRPPEPMTLLTDDRGQAATEYALLVAMTVMIAVGTFEAVNAALLDYYRDIAAVICLPIP